MKVKLLSLFLFITSPFIFSQTIKGKIVCNSHVIPKVDVVNTNSKKLSISDANGYFSIDSKINDTLVFIAKNYELKKIIISPITINDKNLIIELTLKAEELKEVVITKIENKTTWLTKEAIEQIKLNSSRPKQGLKIEGYKESPTLMGVDFIRIGKQIHKLFKKEKEPVPKEKTTVPFKDLIKKSCDQNYFFETLKLKPEEIEAFLTFCDFDPESKKMLSKNSNNLELMDFLYKKSVEFKKINAPE